jgi:hypothetical protein
VLLLKGGAGEMRHRVVPKSTRGERYLEMHEIKKGNQWYFGQRLTLVSMRIRAWCTRCRVLRPISTARR